MNLVAVHLFLDYIYESLVDMLQAGAKLLHYLFSMRCMRFGT